MNLRQKYKRAKQRIEMLEQRPVIPVIYDTSRGEVVTLKRKRELEIGEGKYKDLVIRDIARDLGVMTARYADINSERDPITGKLVVHGTLKVIKKED